MMRFSNYKVLISGMASRPAVFLLCVLVYGKLTAMSADREKDWFFREVVRYPAFFLIDRKGQLQPAPGPDQPFEKAAAAVDALLNGSSSSGPEPYKDEKAESLFYARKRVLCATLAVSFLVLCAGRVET